eukprot:Filipodium_phascolosomae@DN1965_c0_g1_i1.p1
MNSIGKIASGGATSEKKSTWARPVACLCIGLIIVTWLTMAELVQGIETQYPNTYFLTYMAHSFYATCLIPWVFMKCSHGHGKYTGYFDWCYYFGASIPTAIFAFVSGWFWYLSLPITSVSGNSAIYQSSSCMVFMFSICFLNEKVDPLKSTSVVLCIAGVCFVSFFPASSNRSSGGEEGGSDPHFLGYVLCFLSMVLYALYEVLYKKWAVHMKDEFPIANSVRFLGLVGVSTFLFCAPPLLVLDSFGIESFFIPKTGEAIKSVLLLGVLDTVFNMLLLIAIGLSSPLFASVGCLLVLPVSMVWDKIAHNYSMPGPAMMGVGLIILGFVAFGISEANQLEEIVPVSDAAKEVSTHHLRNFRLSKGHGHVATLET